MGYSAVGVSQSDLQFGTTFLQKITKTADFPFLSANLIEKKTGNHAFKPHTIVDRGNTKIGFLGLTREHDLKSTDFQITDYKKALETSLTALKNVDLVILLSNLPHAENLNIASNYKDIHIIFENGEKRKGRKTIKVENTIISQTPAEGKYLGELRIDWKKSKQWENNIKEEVNLKNEIDRLQWFKGRIEKRGGPDVAYKKGSKNRQIYDERMRKLADLELKLEKELQKTTPDIDFSTYQQALHPLKPSISDDPETSKILKSSRKEANKLRKKNGVLNRFTRFTGSQSCKECHRSIYDRYAKTDHSTAYKTLVDKLDHNNPNCVFCHVTGLPERLSYIQPEIPTRLQQVGCENCHGEGKRHIKDPKKYKMVKNVPETTCLVCHTKDHSDDFNYSRDIELVH